MKQEGAGDADTLPLSVKEEGTRDADTFTLSVKEEEARDADTFTLSVKDEGARDADTFTQTESQTRKEWATAGNYQTAPKSSSTPQGRRPYWATRYQKKDEPLTAPQMDVWGRWKAMPQCG